MIKTKTQIEKQLKKKTNLNLVETIIAAKKNESWREIAAILAGSRKNWTNVNLNDLNKKVKSNETLIIPGKVLSNGDINKKVKVVALGFSEKAKEKLLKAKCEVLTILEEIKKNPTAKNTRILTNKENESN